MSSVAFLGPLGTYTHEATLRFFHQRTSENLVPQKTIADCFEALISGSCNLAVIPFENSSNGSVIQTFDLFRDKVHDVATNHIQVIGHVFVPITHCVLTVGPADLSQVQRVYSHPQVWGQVENWYRQHFKNVDAIDTSSTSKAVELAKSDPHAAAIASKYAGIHHNVPIVVDNISDMQNNTTRFLVLSKGENSVAIQGTNEDLTLHAFLSFSVRNREPGALSNAIAVFGQHNLNLVQIASRPSRKEQWDYLFFIEVEGPRDALNAAVSELRLRSTDLTLFGIFPANLNSQ